MFIQWHSRAIHDSCDTSNNSSVTYENLSGKPRRTSLESSLNRNRLVNIGCQIQN